MDDLGELIGAIMSDAWDGSEVSDQVVEGLADSLGIGRQQVEDLAGAFKGILADERALGAIAEAESVDQAIESLASLLVQLKG